MTLWYLPILALVVCFSGTLPLFFQAVWHKQKARLLLFKALSTCCALAVALVGAVLSGGAWRWLTVMAITLCTAADVMLELHFVGGMGLFMAAHFFTIASFLLRRAFDLNTVLLLVVTLLVASAVLLHWRPMLQKGQLLPFAVYGVVLSVMGASGASLLFARQAPLTLAAIGAILFTVSDLMVGEETLKPRSKPFQVAVMVLYEGAQVLFAAACL